MSASGAIEYPSLNPDSVPASPWFGAVPGTSAWESPTPIARDGVTIRPLNEERLFLKTFLASQADNDSKLTSEMARAFGRKLRLIEGSAQLHLPISNSRHWLALISRIFKI